MSNLTGRIRWLALRSPILRFLMRQAIQFASLFLMLWPVFSMADQTDAYWTSLNAITPGLLDHSFVSMNRTPECPTSGICRLVNSQNDMSDIEQSRFVYVRPLIVTNSQSEFLDTLKHATACQSLGILSLVRPINGDGTDPDSETYDFIRPTYGFALYNIMTAFGKVYLIRAEGYVDSGVQAANQYSIDDDSQPSRLNLTPSEGDNPLFGSFVDVRPGICRVYGRRVAFSKSITYGKSTGLLKKVDNKTWLVNPIEFHKRLFIVNAYQINLSGASPTERSIVLDISERLSSGWSSTFTLISK